MSRRHKERELSEVWINLFSHLEANMHQNIIYKIGLNNLSVKGLKERKDIRRFAETAEKISF